MTARPATTKSLFGLPRRSSAPDPEDPGIAAPVVDMLTGDACAIATKLSAYFFIDKHTQRRLPRDTNTDTTGHASPAVLRAARLGKGSFGRTYSMKNSLDDGLRAVKVIDFQSGAAAAAAAAGAGAARDGAAADAAAAAQRAAAADVRAKALLEVKTLQALQHPNIVKYFQAEEDVALGRLLVVMELCGPTLLHKLPSMSLDDAREYSLQCAGALAYLHGEIGFIHRDLKLDNVFLSFDGHCRIGDFGLARRAARSSTNNRFGSSRNNNNRKSSSRASRNLHSRSQSTGSADSASMGVAGVSKRSSSSGGGTRRWKLGSFAACSSSAATKCTGRRKT